MGKNIFLAFLLIVISAGLYYAAKNVSSSNSLPESGNVACTADAKICPDGSGVGRTGPNCEFAECPAGNTDTNINSFEECIAAGNPAMESYPRQCRTQDGKHFVEDISDKNDDPVIFNAKLNETISALGVQITPLEVVEDNRCPDDVVCIWAGTVKVRTMLSSGLGEAEQIFELGQPITTEVEEITLIKVRPDTVSTENIEEGTYEFVFQIEMR